MPRWKPEPEILKLSDDTIDLIGEYLEEIDVEKPLRHTFDIEPIHSFFEMLAEEFNDRMCEGEEIDETLVRRVCVAVEETKSLPDHLFIIHYIDKRLGICVPKPIHDSTIRLIKERKDRIGIEFPLRYDDDPDKDDFFRAFEYFSGEETRMVQADADGGKIDRKVLDEIRRAVDDLLEGVGECIDCEEFNRRLSE